MRLRIVGLVLSWAAFAHAEPAAEAEVKLPEDAKVDLSRDGKPAADATAPPPEAPPPAPYKKGIVLDSSLGARFFLGEFGKLVQPAPLLHVQLGYEVLKWLMLYGEAELAFSDTSKSQDQPKVRAFAMYGFGGGARFTWRFTERLGAFVQGGLGAMKADVPANALGILGFRDAESLGVYLGGRLGVEWYQVDRHLALGLQFGARTPQGFARTGASTDTALALDATAAIRYAF